MARLLRISVFLLVLLTVTIDTWAVDYKVVILNPPGSPYAKLYATSGDQQVGHGWIPGSSGAHALLWSGTPESAIDLTPNGFEYNSEAFGVSDGQQVGRGRGTATGGLTHALLWSGTVGSLVDLHPANLLGPGSVSFAWGVSGGCQVGEGWEGVSPYRSHALLWYGTAESVMDLTPDIPGIEAGISGVSGNQQVGWCWGIPGDTSNHTNYHAYLWSGTAASAVDLHPVSGFTKSVALGTSGDQQVGYGWVPDTVSWQHALLWKGSASSVVDLHPVGFSRWSEAYGVSNGKQVGWGWNTATSTPNALVWSGTAESVINLHDYLPSEYDDSEAWDIDSSGTIVGLAGNGILAAVMWVPLIYVEIDIKPGSYPNSINLGSEGVIPVAILSSLEFDATTVDPATVELAGAGVELRGKSNKAMAHKEDVNGDGLVDLLVQITIQNLEPGYFQDGYVTLTGKTYDGLFIEGSDEINIVPK